MLCNSLSVTLLVLQPIACAILPAIRLNSVELRLSVEMSFGIVMVYSSPLTFLAASLSYGSSFTTKQLKSLVAQPPARADSVQPPLVEE